MYSYIQVNAYRSALDELAIFPYCESKHQQIEVRKQAIDCLCEIPQTERLNVCRLAIGNLIIGNIDKALHFIEIGLSKSENL